MADPIRIPIHGRKGIVAWTTVDAVDAYYVHERFHLATGGYAMNSAGRLHRRIMGLTKGDGVEVDHVDGDPLNNCRRNLRIVTRAQNQQNLAQMGGTSAYRGVSYRPRHRKWEARAFQAGRNVFIGHFDDEDSAARAASEWRSVHMPYSNEARFRKPAGN